VWAVEKQTNRTFQAAAAEASGHGDGGGGGDDATWKTCWQPHARRKAVLKGLDAIFAMAQVRRPGTPPKQYMTRSLPMNQ
jgi:hypothetical protein